MSAAGFAMPRPKVLAGQGAAWAVVAGLIAFTALCLFTGLAGSLRYTFPVLSVAVGAFLYWLYPEMFVGFCLWLWFLTPCLRRLVDFRSGFEPLSTILLAPHAVSLLTVITFVRNPGAVTKKTGLPFLMALAAIVYGAAVGLPHVPAKDLVIGILNWATPVFFAFHLFVNWRSYPTISSVVRRSFLLGVFVMGAYGLYQFFVLPGWDRDWLAGVIGEGTGLSFGLPEPMQVRVFSTMNSSGTLAPVLMAGLLLLFAMRGWKTIPVAIVGYATFLLTMVRAAWFGWFVGLALLLVYFTVRQRLSLIVVVALVAASLLAAPVAPPLQHLLEERMQSFSDLKKDESANDRLGGYKQLLGESLKNPFGNGIGSMDATQQRYADQTIGARDSAILDMLLSLGWLGALLYGSSLVVLYFAQRRYPGQDSFSHASRAIFIALIAQFPLGSLMLGVNGVALWSFGALWLASAQYRESRDANLQAHRIVEFSQYRRFVPVRSGVSHG
jgi:hypothetical protein